MRIAFLLILASLPAWSTPPTGGGVPSVLADIGPAPGIALVDQSGRPFSLAGLRGKAVLVSFVYTTCNGTCPATTLRLSQARQALKAAGLWGGEVEFVSVSLDPARDTPEVLSAYARVYDADPAAWHFLTGPPETVARVLSDWGMWARVGANGTIDHPSRIFLVDPDARLREIYNLEFFTPETVVQDVKAVVPGARKTP